MIEFYGGVWEDFPNYYESVRLSNNQVKALFHQYVQSFSKIVIKLEEDCVVELNKSEAIQLMMEHLKRKELIEIIHHFYLIQQRNNESTPYLKVILTGLLSTK